MKKTIWVAVVLMFVVSACGSSGERSQSPAVGSKVTVVDHSPTTTYVDSAVSDPDTSEVKKLELPVLERHAQSRPRIDVERVRNLIEMHGNADPRFKDAKKADGFVHLLSIWDIPLDQAGALLDEVMVKWRVVQRDCQYLAVTEDWRPGRVNLSVTDDLVVGWQVEGAEHAHGSTWCASNAGDTDPVHGILGLDLSEAAAILDAAGAGWRLVGRGCPFEPIPVTMDLVQGRLNLTTVSGVVARYSVEHMDGPDNVYKMEPQPACEVELRTAASSTITYLEGGGYDFLPFSLSEAPLVPVIVRFEALDPTEVALSDESVVEIEVTVDNYEMFGPSWRAPQDGIDDGDQTTQVRVSVIAVPSDLIFGNTKDLIITVITKDRAPSIDDH